MTQQNEARDFRRRPIACLLGEYRTDLTLHEQLRTAATTLSGMIEAGNFRRLPSDSIRDMRGLHMFLIACAEAALAERDAVVNARIERVRQRAGWWRRLVWRFS